MHDAVEPRGQTRPAVLLREIPDDRPSDVPDERLTPGPDNGECVDAALSQRAQQVTADQASPTRDENGGAAQASIGHRSGSAGGPVGASVVVTPSEVPMSRVSAAVATPRAAVR